MNVLEYKQMGGFASSSELERFLISSIEAVHFLAEQGHSHNDIKTTNFLVSNKNENVFDFYLSDFGLTDKERGGTPIFASPEG